MVTEADPLKLDPKKSNTTVLVPPGGTIWSVPTNLGELESKPSQISSPFQSIFRRTSLPVHVIRTPVTLRPRSPLLVTSTDTSSPWTTSPLVSQSQSSGGEVLVGGGGEVLVGGGVLVGGTDDGVAVGAVVGEGDGGAKEAV
jgi:hypothetical protein